MNSTALFIPLYTGEHICLGPIDHEKDPEVESRWTHDANFLQMYSTQPAMPLSVAQMKKRYEALEKSLEEARSLEQYFTIRLKEDDRLVGLAHFNYLDWTNASGGLRLGIGDPADRRKGYGREALSLLLRYAFREMNLYRLAVEVPEYNLPALALARQAGFVEEVRRRQALNRFGRRWDMFVFSLLSPEWLERNAAWLAAQTVGG